MYRYCSETWLHEGIENDILSIPNYNLIRQDRSVGRGGGVCAFVSNSIPYKRWTDLENPLYECLWLSLRPCYIFVDTCDVCKIREEFPPIILFYTLKSLIIYVSRTWCQIVGFIAFKTQQNKHFTDPVIRGILSTLQSYFRQRILLNFNEY